MLAKYTTGDSIFGCKSRHLKYFVLKPSGLISWGDNKNALKYKERVEAVSLEAPAELKLSDGEKSRFMGFRTTGKELWLVADDDGVAQIWREYAEFCTKSK